jgi:4a-hydroxytetrahydrobiopterin dehydratase
MSDLLSKKCIPCEGGTAPLTPEEVATYMQQVSDWRVSEDNKVISKQFKFKDFAEALTFTNQIGAIAEEEGHHPDLMLGWGKVGVSLTTHEADGLSENDFILAAKIDALNHK